MTPVTNISIWSDNDDSGYNELRPLLTDERVTSIKLYIFTTLAGSVRAGGAQVSVCLEFYELSWPHCWLLAAASDNYLLIHQFWHLHVAWAASGGGADKELHQHKLDVRPRDSECCCTVLSKWHSIKVLTVFTMIEWEAAEICAYSGLISSLLQLLLLRNALTQ